MVTVVVVGKSKQPENTTFVFIKILLDPNQIA